MPKLHWKGFELKERGETETVGTMTLLHVKPNGEVGKANVVIAG